MVVMGGKGGMGQGVGREDGGVVLGNRVGVWLRSGLVLVVMDEAPGTQKPALAKELYRHYRHVKINNVNYSVLTLFTSFLS